MVGEKAVFYHHLVNLELKGLFGLGGIAFNEVGKRPYEGAHVQGVRALVLDQVGLRVGEGKGGNVKFVGIEGVEETDVCVGFADVEEGFVSAVQYPYLVQ